MQAPDAFDPPIGVPHSLAPDLRRIVAPNPSPMTYRGTNTYILGHGPYAIIDPGPQIQSHLDALLALGPISHIFVTHAHLDHSPLARPLSEVTGAPVFAFGPATAGRSAIMQDLATSGDVGGGEGIDTDFHPDHTLTDGDEIAGEGWRLKALHTPGHIGNHLSFQWNDACFTGDHVMGWASSLVSPPDGDLTDFMASCAKLGTTTWRIFYPGHGAEITEPNARLDWLVSHRKAREAAILACLGAAPGTAKAIARQIYTDTPPALLPAAERNVLAHLIDLAGRGLATYDAPLSANSEYTLKA